MSQSESYFFEREDLGHLFNIGDYPLTVQVGTTQAAAVIADYDTVWV